MKKFVFGILVAALVGMVSASARAAEEDGVIFDAGAGAGVYGQKGQATDFVVDVSGTLVLDTSGFSGDNGRLTSELALIMSGRQGVEDLRATPIKFREIVDGRVGFEVSGFPMKYRRDDGYYEISAVDVRLVYEGEIGGDGSPHKVTLTGGVNPFTRRNYGNSVGGFVTNEDPVAVSEGYVQRPEHARVFGAPDYRHDPGVNGTYLDNRDVWFGGGTMERQIRTSFDTSESSFRVPLSAEYKFRSQDKKLTLKATAYYTLRVGRDSLTQNDRYSDLYRGYVSYTNVAWHTCEDDRGRLYDCDPHGYQYNGDGVIEQRYTNSTGLDARTFSAHVVGGQGEALYSLYKSEAMELLLNGRLRGEYDSHVMVPGRDGNVQNARDSLHYVGTGGVLVRF